ncbi:MAG: DUF4157 domain-containing protein [Solirubrobacteraceae bacterium]
MTPAEDRAEASVPEVEAVQRPPPAPEAPAVDVRGAASDRRALLLALQRSAGNAAVGRLLRQSSGPDADPHAVAARLGPGRPLDPAVHRTMSSALGDQLGPVRVHDDQAAGRLTESLGARAVAVGEHVVFAPGEYQPGTPVGDALLAHELAHVAQQRGPAPTAEPPGLAAELERDADSAALSAVEVLHGGARAPRGMRRAMRSGLRLQRCNGNTKTAAKDAGVGAGPPPPVFDATAASSQLNARNAVLAYSKLGDADRRAQFDIAFKGKTLAPVLRALGSDDAAKVFADQVRELLQWVEEEETLAFSGMSKAKLAEAEAKWQYAKSKAEAQKNAGKKPVTDADVAKETQKAQKEKSYYHPKAKTRYDSLSKAKQTEWDTRAAKAITAMVAFSNKNHPEVVVTAAQLHWDPNAIDANAPGAFAQGDGAGKAAVGFEFVTAVELNPAYAMSTVVHELYGHPEFDSAKNWQLKLFQEAAKSIPGYFSDPTTEETSYGYHESEIYSLMRELPYWTGVSAADKANKKKDGAAVAKADYDPRDAIGWELDDIISEWEPGVLHALIHGFFKRQQMDPRIQPMALTALADQIEAKFPGDAAKILK